MKLYNLFYSLVWRTLPLLLFALVIGCQSDDLKDPTFEVGNLDLTLSSDNVGLTPEFYASNFKFSWTPADNKGTGASISYILEIDKAGNDFTTPVIYELGKNVYSKDISYADLNTMLLTVFGAVPGSPVVLEARATASFANNIIEAQQSVASFTVTPYQPLTNTLYIVGNATPSGWNIENATPMLQSGSNPYIFTYNGQLSPGEFKLPVNTDGCWCQDFYTRDAGDPNKMIYNQGGSGDDLKWQVTTAGLYKVTANVLELSITIEEMAAPPFSQLWIVGDASPSGWDINSPEAFTVSENPFVFTYEATFVPGEFKILAGTTGDWCGQWYRPLVNHPELSETSVQQNSGCDGDTKWQITAATAGRYKITLNMVTNEIYISPVEVYLIGDATPNSWNMGSLVPMSKNGSVYTWTGDLSAGEFKFTKFNTNWCEGTEIVANTPAQNITNGAYHYRENCNGDDNKWIVSAAQAGIHTIQLNLDTSTLTIN